MEVHGTVHGTSTVHLPAYVKNHGILSGRDLQFLLRETKVRVKKRHMFVLNNSGRFEHGLCSHLLLVSYFSFMFIVFVCLKHKFESCTALVWWRSRLCDLCLAWCSTTREDVLLCCFSEVSQLCPHLSLFPRSKLDFNFPVVSTSCKLLERARLLHLHTKRVNSFD